VEGGLSEAIHEGVQAGYLEGFLRKSVVADPLFNRVNTGTNTPAIIHHSFVPGDQLEIAVMLKGGGCENRSQFQMLTPAQGQEGVENFVVEVVRRAGADACPPFVVGVGIGGNFEMSCLLAKKALLRPLGSIHPVAFYAEMEKNLFRKINELGIGPQGIGGKTTTLGIFIEIFPCHIASLPVAVNIECHSHRHGRCLL
jgi:fumarate hydratase subunit alpha